MNIDLTNFSARKIRKYREYLKNNHKSRSTVVSYITQINRAVFEIERLIFEDSNED